MTRAEDRTMTGSKVCFECGKNFMWMKGQMIFVEREYGGNPVRMHKNCAERNETQKTLTASVNKEGTHDDFKFYQARSE